MSDRLERRERRHLRWRLVLFVLAIAAPSGLLLLKALDQLKWESLRQTQLAAEALMLGIDERLSTLIREQDRRAFVEFSFLTIAGDPAAGFVQRSPLATYPVEPLIPGLIAWFQVDAAGNLSTPLLPAAGSDVGAYGIDAAELAERQRLERQVEAILASNSLSRRAGDSRTTRRDEAAATVRPKGPVSAEGLHAEHPGSYENGQALFERLYTRQRNEREATGLDAGTATSAPAPAPAPGLPQAVSDRPFSSLDTDEMVARERARALRTEQSVLPEEQEIIADAAFGAAAPMPSSRRALPERKHDRAASTQIPPDTAGREGLARSTEDETRTTPRQDIRSRPTPIPPSTAKEPEADRPTTASPPAAAQRTIIRTFESELGPFRFDRLDSSHFLLYRWAWRDGARYVQGALLEAASFLDQLVEAPFAASTLPRSARLEVLWSDGATEGVMQPLTTYAVAPGSRYDLPTSGELPAGTLVHQARLTEPFGALRLRFDAVRLPHPPGASVIYWLGGVLALVLLIGGWMLYRLGQRQLALSRQQRDFVAAVSHELRTPLTSIRLYSEMLKSGWAAENKRQSYYRFIHDEAERLSRLVANVLQLARMTRDELRVEPRPIPLAELLQQAQPTLDNLTKQADFSLSVDCSTDLPVLADPDAFTQVLINLVDNSIKFVGPDAPEARRRVAIHCSAQPRGASRRNALYTAQGEAVVTVRDHGPGIAKQQHRRALALFQRLGNEATRDTKGTGIGLALVERLMQAMGGSVELGDAKPGLEVRLHLRVVAGPNS